MLLTAAVEGSLYGFSFGMIRTIVLVVILTSVFAMCWSLFNRVRAALAIQSVSQRDREFTSITIRGLLYAVFLGIVLTAFANMQPFTPRLALPPTELKIQDSSNAKFEKAPPPIVTQEEKNWKNRNDFFGNHNLEKGIK